ncbi:MAG: alginate export family protein [Gammaproteobacteria bacterium]|nr:alginate export family protein [Gammaproteobacteria bacterium]
MKIKQLLACMVLCVSIPSWSLADENNGSSIEFKAPPKTSYRLGEHLWFGADIVNAVEFNDNYHLDSDADDHLLFIEPELRAVVAYTPAPGMQLFAELQLDGRKFLSQGEASDEHAEGHIRIEQLYIDYTTSENTSVRVGRQRYQDARSWWYDDKIDALRAQWRHGYWSIEATAARENAFTDDFAHGEAEVKIDYYMLSAGRVKGKRDQYTLFLMQKNDRNSTKDEDPLLLGMQRVGEIGDNIRYWLDAAIERGERRGRKIRAFGADGGFSLRFDGKWEPFVTIGLAYGSGDDHLSDGVDGNFRQTDIQDNEGRTFGITSYKYYGEISDFELANLWVGTLGVGVRPSRNLTAELIYHRYRQDEADDDLFDTDLEMEPVGKRVDLGQELDFVLGYRASDNLKLSVIVGVFDPGSAFAATANAAWLAKVKLAYRF